MKILLTGASSYVGARLFFDLSKNHEIIGTYFGHQLSKKFIPLDVTNAEEVKKIISDQRPNLIIHAAANANPRWCEANPDLAIQLNQESTKYIVDAANSVHSKVFLISSFAALSAQDVYGKTKRQSEKYIQKTEAGFIILQPSLIVGFSPNTTNDRPFNRILKNLDEKTEAIYDISWKFQPTYLGHISEVIEKIIGNRINNEFIPISVPELKSRYDLAKDILEPFGIQAEPIDKQDNTPVTQNDLSKLKSFGLSQYSYQEIIPKIVSEIKNRQIYALP